jgi:orotidine-5'-phosphate decarboxylase
VAEIILALDLPTASEALRLLDRVPGTRWVKIGSILFTRDGPELVREARRRGISVFLDLKWHDIPNTVAGAVASARELGVQMATVHALGGREMLEAAAAAAGPELGLVAVTVLTSHDPRSYAQALGRGVVELGAEVERQTDVAAAAGLRGVVCSPHEVAAVRSRLAPGAWIVVPGIRRSADAAGDQKRTAGPGDAARDGATHLVVGRPVLQAADPVLALGEFVREAACAPR